MSFRYPIIPFHKPKADEGDPEESSTAGMGGEEDKRFACAVRVQLLASFRGTQYIPRKYASRWRGRVASSRRLAQCTTLSVDAAFVIRPEQANDESTQYPPALACEVKQSDEEIKMKDA